MHVRARPHETAGVGSWCQRVSKSVGYMWPATCSGPCEDAMLAALALRTTGKCSSPRGTCWHHGRQQELLEPDAVRADVQYRLCSLCGQNKTFNRRKRRAVVRYGAVVRSSCA